MRRAAKADDNQPQIVKAFRQMGFSVAHTHTIGKGFPDIVVGRDGINTLVEIKDGDKVKSKKQLTADEKEFHQMWLGEIVIIESIEEVIKFANSKRNV
jgi:Holliday junction resolvase